MLSCDILYYLCQHTYDFSSTEPKPSVRCINDSDCWCNWRSFRNICFTGIKHWLEKYLSKLWWLSLSIIHVTFLVGNKSRKNQLEKQQFLETRGWVFSKFSSCYLWWRLLQFTKAILLRTELLCDQFVRKTALHNIAKSVHVIKHITNVIIHNTALLHHLLK